MLSYSEYELIKIDLVHLQDASQLVCTRSKLWSLVLLLIVLH